MVKLWMYLKVETDVVFFWRHSKVSIGLNRTSWMGCVQNIDRKVSFLWLFQCCPSVPTAPRGFKRAWFCFLFFLLFISLFSFFFFFFDQWGWGVSLWCCCCFVLSGLFFFVCFCMLLLLCFGFFFIKAKVVPKIYRDRFFFHNESTHA